MTSSSVGVVILFCLFYVRDLQAESIRQFQTYHDSKGPTFKVTNTPCQQTNNVTDVIINCKGLSLDRVNSNWFPLNTTVIFLDYNLLTEIENYTFKNLTQLRLLNLSNNKIYKMHTNAFSGLTNLEVLNLEYNALEFDNNSYPDGIFSPLINLMELYLIQEQDYIKSEYSSCFLCPLKNLTTLSIDSVGETVNFGPEFKRLGKLTNLFLTVCSYYIIESTFKNLNRLRQLALDGVSSNFSNMALAYLPLLDSFTFSSSKYVAKKQALHILQSLEGRNMSMIRFFRVFGNPPEDISSNSMNDEYLDLSENQWMGSKIAFLRLLTLRNLENVYFYGALEDDTGSKCLDLTDNGFRNATGKFQGLTGLKTVLFSGNHFSDFSPTFLDSFSTVENLALSNCRFDLNSFQSNSLRIFMNLKSLRRLDVSLNSLSFLAPNTFSTNPNMTELYLVTNRFTEIPFNLKLTPNLRVLDLRKNTIWTLEEAVLIELDELAEKNGQFSLRLAGNVLSCSCENFYFIKWILTTNVDIDFNSNLMCVNESGLYTHLDKHWNVGKFWRQCVGQQYLYVSGVILCVILIILLMSFVAMRCKLYIKAWFAQIFGTVPRRRLTDFQNHVFIVSSPNDDFVTVLSNYLKQTFFLRTRDFGDLEPMRPEIDGLFAEINATWRIILVVTVEFFHDNNFQMLYTMVLNSMSHDNPGKVLLLYERNVQLNVDLINAICEDNILEVPLWQMTPNMDNFLYERIFIDY
ncbi:toll-like receptor 13 [Physella acuta]|uniref:toll-like receptor 13 n=1 Tax=Physella acuta TaxID=109671 RepID=UPI0027DB37B3|nr:toll-like receptor 13 [Physella acuta]